MEGNNAPVMAVDEVILRAKIEFVRHMIRRAAAPKLLRATPKRTIDRSKMASGIRAFGYLRAHTELPIRRNTKNSQPSYWPPNPHVHPFPDSSPVACYRPLAACPLSGNLEEGRGNERVVYWNINLVCHMG